MTASIQEDTSNSKPIIANNVATIQFDHCSTYNGGINWTKTVAIGDLEYILTQNATSASFSPFTQTSVFCLDEEIDYTIVTEPVSSFITVDASQSTISIYSTDEGLVGTYVVKIIANVPAPNSPDNTSTFENFFTLNVKS
jgi:hypothetical protein